MPSDLEGNPLPSGPPHAPVPALIRWWVCLAGALTFAIAGAIGGYMDLLNSEYKAAPRDQAIIMALQAGLAGVMAGLLIGIVIDALRLRRWSRARRGKHA